MDVYGIASVRRFAEDARFHSESDADFIIVLIKRTAARVVENELNVRQQVARIDTHLRAQLTEHERVSSAFI